MEITGKIIFALERRAGKSARTGNDWASQSYVLETHDQYPRRMVCVWRRQNSAVQYPARSGVDGELRHRCPRIPRPLVQQYPCLARDARTSSRSRSGCRCQPASRRARRDDAGRRRCTIRTSARSRRARPSTSSCRRRNGRSPLLSSFNFYEPFLPYCGRIGFFSILCS